MNIDDSQIRLIIRFNPFVGPIFHHEALVALQSSQADFGVLVAACIAQIKRGRAMLALTRTASQG